MPRPILKQNAATDSQSLLSATPQQVRELSAAEQMKLYKLLRSKRSKRYMEALHRLDAGGHAHNRQAVCEIMNAIKQEFPEIDISGILIGIVSKCYLGVPYEVHTLSIAGNIIEHYKKSEALPEGLECARNMAAPGTYEFIEVYNNCLRAISPDGTVSVVKK